MKKIKKSEEEWKKKLTPEQFRVLREKETEAPFTGKLLKNKEKGIYVCAACENELFSSKTKYDSGCGWPSFWDSIGEGKIELKEDNSHRMRRIELLCKKCGSHLGHLFDDGPKEKSGKRYCVNSVSLDFKKI